MIQVLVGVVATLTQGCETVTGITKLGSRKAILRQLGWRAISAATSYVETGLGQTTPVKAGRAKLPVHRLGSCGSMKLNMLIGTLVLGTMFSAPSYAGGLLDRMLGLKGSGCDSSCCDTGCAVDPSCGCEIASCGGGCEPTCGVEMSACAADPSCGCEISACDPCGSAAPSCGCEISACDPCGTSCKPRRKPLLELLGKVHAKKQALVHRLMTPSCGGCDTGCADPTCGCEIADPTCGCEIAACDPCGAAPSCGCEIAACDPCGGCDSACGKKCGGLLSKLFKRKNSCCDAVVCDSGCSSCSSCGTTSAMPAPISAPAVHGDAAPMPPAPVVDPSAYLQSNRRVIQATSYVR